MIRLLDKIVIEQFDTISPTTDYIEIYIGVPCVHCGRKTAPAIWNRPPSQRLGSRPQRIRMQRSRMSWRYQCNKRRAAR